VESTRTQAAGSGLAPRALDPESVRAARPDGDVGAGLVFGRPICPAARVRFSERPAHL